MYILELSLARAGSSFFVYSEVFGKGLLDGLCQTCECVCVDVYVTAIVISNKED